MTTRNPEVQLPDNTILSVWFENEKVSVPTAFWFHLLTLIIGKYQQLEGLLIEKLVC